MDGWSSCSLTYSIVVLPWLWPITASMEILAALMLKAGNLAAPRTVGRSGLYSLWSAFILASYVHVRLSQCYAARAVEREA